MDWQVHIVVDIDHHLDSDDYDILERRLAEHSAAVGAAAPGDNPATAATMTVRDAASAGDAARAGFDALATALAAAGRRVTGWSAAEAITETEADRRLTEPTIPALVSGVEAAEILGVSRQRVHQLAAENPAFPPPVARLASGSIWLRSGVEGFARRWTRKPGRPAKVS